MLEGLGSPAWPRAAASASVAGSSGPAACPPPSPSAPRSPESPAPRRGGVRASVPQKLAEMLSSQYGLIVFVAGLLLLLAWAVHAAGVSKSDLLCFLTALMLLQMLWMLWYVGRSSAHRRLFRLKDTHARSITLFAVITIILGCLKIRYFIGFSELYPRLCRNLFGVIHLVFTNLLLWANGVLNESKHQLNEHKEWLITLGFGNITTVLDDHTPQCNCTPPTLCTTISHGIYYIYYLYPFNIEYQILASTVLYVLWKNIGCKVDSHQHQKMQFKPDGVTVGTVLGLTALAATIAVVVVSTHHILPVCHHPDDAYGGCGAGWNRNYRTDEKSLDKSKNPPRKLDSDLLVGTASGSWLISWGSILAILCAEDHPHYTWYNLPYSIVVIMEKYIQNLFIFESIHREPKKLSEDIQTLRMVTVCNGNTMPLASSCLKSGGVARDVAPWGRDMPPAANGNVCLRESCDKEEKQEESSWGGNPSPVHLPRFLQGNTKRKVLRNIAAFLFLCNTLLWIPPAFGCRPEYDNGLEEIVFGFEPWIIVVNLAMPFSIFYGMHAAASLFEVYYKI
uniref:OTOP1 n=1 Tax=Pan troglodytes TaxID=9598 RepID=A0A2I3TM97_PANTR